MTDTPAQPEVHDPAILANARAILDQVITGEYPIALVIFNHHAALSAASGAPVAWVKLEPIPAALSVVGLLKHAPHPNAAKLWQELIYSDEAQLLYLKGYAHPIRFDALNKAGKIPADLAAKLPAAALYTKVILMTDAAQADAAAATVKANWTIVINS